MRLNDVKLIREIRKNPCVWDEQYDRNKSNVNTKVFTWAKIGYLLGERVDECKKRWKVFYDRFDNTYKGSASKDNIPTQLYKEMSFLIPVLELKRKMLRTAKDYDGEQEENHDKLVGINDFEEIAEKAIEQLQNENNVDDTNICDEMVVEYLEETEQNAEFTLSEASTSLEAQTCNEVFTTTQATKFYTIVNANANTDNKNSNKLRKISTNPRLGIIYNIFEKIPKSDAIVFKTETLQFANQLFKYYKVLPALKRESSGMQ